MDREQIVKKTWELRVLVEVSKEGKDEGRYGRNPKLIASLWTSF